MVHAIKDYSSRSYRRTDSNNVLNMIIRRFSGETTYPYKHRKNEKSYIDTSIQNLAVNSIIEGYFPKEKLVQEMAVKRVNKMLCVAICSLIAIVIVSYYFVITCEMKLNDLSRQTVVLNNENEELQNKLDSLKSFNNVDKTLQQNNMLQKSGKVIETEAVTVDSEEALQKISKKKSFKYAIGF